MKIEIDYNGSIAICKIDGKHIHECGQLTIARALNAFNTIGQHLKREGIIKCTTTDIRFQ